LFPLLVVDERAWHRRRGVQLRTAERRAYVIAAGIAQVISGVALFTVNETVCVAVV